MLYLILLYPVIAVLWFLNLVTLLEKMKDVQNTHNQKLLGAVYSFFLAVPVLMILIGLYE